MPAGLEMALMGAMNKGRPGQSLTILTHLLLRNTEKLIMLIAQGILPPEAQPPTLRGNPTAIYNSWLSSLPPGLRSSILSVVPECSAQKQFLKVSEDGPRQAGRCWAASQSPASHNSPQG